MSGECNEEGSSEWMWAHLLWQKRGIRFEDYVSMNRNTRLMYIASELLSRERPIASADKIAIGLIRKR